MKKTFLLLLLPFCFAGCKKAAQETVTVTGGEQTDKRPQAHASATPFVVVMIPDTQYYMDADSHGGNLTMFQDQINWILTTKANGTQNIVYVGGLGDIVDNPTITSDWDQAKTEYQKLLNANIPFGLSVGNHDQSPYNPVGNTTTAYNARFGRTTFHNKPWYGGNLEGTSSNNNDSHYDLFSASGIDFIVIHVEYDDGNAELNVPANQQKNVSNTWVNNLLGIYPSRKAIIITHSMVTTGGGFSAQADSLYQKIKARQNVFMMYGGHFYARNSRVDTYPVGGNTIRSYICNYQNEPAGGNGFMRILTFKPDQNQIAATSYSPYASASYTTANEQFVTPMFTTSYVFPEVVAPTADAHVRNGQYANSNIGTATTLAERNGSVPDGSYKSYLKFDLSAVTLPIVNAKLRVYGNASVTGTNATTFNCFGTADTWTETGITWNNGPAAVGAALGSNWINTLNNFREFNVTAFVQAQKTADNTASFQLTASQDILCSMYSRENATTANRPQLLIYH